MSDSNSSINKADFSHWTLDKRGKYRIAHKTPSASISAALLKYSWPLLPFAGCLVWGCIWSPSLLQEPATLAGFLIAVILAFAYLSLLCLLSFHNFELRQHGISLPLAYYLVTGGVLKWKWSQLVSVVFSRSSEAISTADQLVLGLQFGPEILEVHIRFQEIDHLDLKKLIYAVVTNAPHAVIQPKLEEVALEFPTVSGIKYLNLQSFTSIWDEEFSTRYSPTLFVPLAPDHELRNGAIKISELVACGGSAAIYSAKNFKGEQIIVKEAVIPKNATEALKNKAIELFNREALLLSKLDHPNLAKVLDHFVENEHHYEVIEYIDGLDLRRFVKERGPQPEDFVLNWARQICEILIYLHSQDPPIIHRDLTPDNLVLKVDGQLVLIDFGAANAFVGTATGTMVGKQSYMPPEQLRGKSVPQSDIYALGCTCYFLLTGKDPTPLEVSQVEDGARAKLNPLLAKCTAIEVSSRFESAQAVLHEILSIRRQRQSEAVQEPIPKSTQV